MSALICNLPMIPAMLGAPLTDSCNSANCSLGPQGASALPGTVRGSEAASLSAQQIEDEYDDRHNDQNVDQAAANVKGESEQPQDQKYDEDCPKHKSP